MEHYLISQCVTQEAVRSWKRSVFWHASSTQIQ